MTPMEEVFSAFPVLETKRLRLRQACEKDATGIFELFSDTEAMQYWGSPPFRHLFEAEERISDIHSAFEKREGIRWIITLKPGDEYVGSVGFWRIIRRHFRAELGYELMPRYWGQGIMQEALGAVVRFGFEQMQLHSIEANVDPANTASARVLERTGFEREGLLRENYYYDGKFFNTALYSMVNEM